MPKIKEQLPFMKSMASKRLQACLSTLPPDQNN